VISFYLQVRRDKLQNKTRSTSGQTRALAETTAAKSALYRLLQLVSRSLRHRAQIVYSLLERTLAEHAKFDEEPRLPRSLVAESWDMVLKGTMSCAFVA
jgi:DNA-binding transcriptional MocR family regulator